MHGFGTQSDRHRWVRGQLRREGWQSRCQHAQRLVRPLKFDFREMTTHRKAGMARWLTLAEAPCVTDLLIRRQHFRDIETASLSWLLGGLPSLQSLHRENWRLITEEKRLDDDRRYAVRTGTRLTRQKQACVFRYDAADASSDQFCRPTWRSTWAPERDLAMRADVLKAWETVARSLYPCSWSAKPIWFTCRSLPVEYPGEKYLCYGDMLRSNFLKLSIYVLHPTSAVQALEEAHLPADRRLWYLDQ